jgi:hypothetical protein
MRIFQAVKKSCHDYPDTYWIGRGEAISKKLCEIGDEEHKNSIFKYFELYGCLLLMKCGMTCLSLPTYIIIPEHDYVVLDATTERLAFVGIITSLRCWCYTHGIKEDDTKFDQSFEIYPKELFPCVYDVLEYSVDDCTDLFLLKTEVNRFIDKLECSDSYTLLESFNKHGHTACILRVYDNTVFPLIEGDSYIIGSEVSLTVVGKSVFDHNYIDRISITS